MAGLMAGPSWYTTEWIVGQLGRTRKGGESAFRDFVSAGRGQEFIWEHLQQQMFLGSGAFIACAQ
jgi:hypothetical protein